MSGTAETITRHFKGDWTGQSGTFPTPGHGPKDRGMSVRDAPGAPDGIVINSFNGGDPLDVKDELRACGILAPRSTQPAKPSGGYVYRDETGAPIFRVIRKAGADKGFYQQHLDAEGQWTKGLNGTNPVPYRLPELIAAPADTTVYICEGEKDADNLAALGMIATTNPGGAGKWRDGFARYLTGHECVILQDNDDAGRAHAADVTRKLIAAGVDCVTLALPGLPDKGDVSDWLAAGGTVSKLVELAGDVWNAPLPTVPTIGLGTITADTLAAMTFPALRYAVPGLIPEGLALLAGKPKFGKSFLALGIGIAVASGGVAFNSVRCDEGDVLYCALEDSPRRLHDRLHKMLPTGRMPSRLHFKTTVPRLGEGLIEWLNAWLDAHPDAKMVILDTWRCIKPAVVRGGSAYDEDATGIAPLHALANSRPGLAIVVIHHTRKMEADDPFDTISGTFGLTGVADTLIVLAKHGESARLSAQGRDLDGYDKAMNRDAMTGGWLLAGDARELAKTGERQAILDVLHEAEGETITLATIASATGKKKDNLAHLLKRLVAEGLVEKAGYGKYRSNPLSNYSNRSNSDDDDDASLNRLNELNGGLGDD